MKFTMAVSTKVFSALASLALSSTLSACVIEEGAHRRLPPGSSSSDRVPSVGASASASAGAAEIPTGGGLGAPMLVVVDTDQVMSANPGQGVGIFAEYATGGKWHLWWTCDTAHSRQNCDVSIRATIAVGTISNISTAELSGGIVTTPTPSRVEARSVTTTEVHGLTFTALPGASVTVEATVGGLAEGPGPNGSFFFFVQAGRINGGFSGRLTNPLQFQGSTP